MAEVIFLQDELIILRALEVNDVPQWASWFNDTVVTEYMNKGMFPVAEADQSNRLNTLYNQQTNNIQLAIVVKQSQVLVGLIGLHKIDWVHRHGDISILIGNEVGRGKGFSKHAVRLVVEHAFNKLNLHKLTSGMWSNNLASEACFKSLGFKYEGCRKAQYFYQGSYVDELNYGLLRKEWLR